MVSVQFVFPKTAQRIFSFKQIDPRNRPVSRQNPDTIEADAVHGGQVEVWRIPVRSPNCGMGCSNREKINRRQVKNPATADGEPTNN
jgi:hypothetical protein